MIKDQKINRIKFNNYLPLELYQFIIIKNELRNNKFT